MSIFSIIRETACKVGIFFAAIFLAVGTFIAIQPIASNSAKTVITIALLLAVVVFIRKPISYGWLRHRAFYLGILLALPVLWAEPGNSIQHPSKKDATIVQKQTDRDDNKKRADSSQKEKTVTTQPNPDIAYNELSLPPEYAKYMPLLRAGAIKVFEQASCERIDYADVSVTKGTKQQPVFYYTCRKNGIPTNIFVSLKELQRSNFALPVAINVEIAKERCEQYIKAQLNFPSTFDSSWFNWSTQEWPNGRRNILIEFTAKNAFNLELPSTATCLFIPTSKGGYKMEGNIFNR